MAGRSGKIPMSVETSDELSKRADRLQAGSRILMISRRARPFAVISAFVGGYILAASIVGWAVAESETPASDWPLLLVGLLLFLEGLWTLVCITPGALLLSAFTSTLVALWLFTTDLGGLKWLLWVLGVFLLFSSYGHVRRFLTFRAVWKYRPSGEEARALSRALNRVMQGRDPETSIEFTLASGGEHLPWKGDFSGPVAILFQPTTGRVICVSPHQFSIRGVGGDESAIWIRGNSFPGSVDEKAREVVRCWASRYGKGGSHGAT